MTNYKRPIRILVAVITVLAFIVCLSGLFSSSGLAEYDFRSIHNETVKIFGKGIYKNDSISVVAQGKASDGVTLFLGIPMLLTSLYFADKGSFKGKLMLTGTLGYFLYTFMSYTFLWTYNPLFLVYVSLMGASLYGFILSFLSFEIEKIPDRFSQKLPLKFLGGFQIFIGFAIGMLWIGKIAPSLLERTVPVGLEHYTTLVIQGMDLGIIVPAAFLSGILLMKRKPMGYLLSSVIIIKGVALLTSITAMIINMALQGVAISWVEILLFPLFNLLAILSLYLLFKNIDKGSEQIG